MIGSPECRRQGLNHYQECSQHRRSKLLKFALDQHEARGSFPAGRAGRITRSIRKGLEADHIVTKRLEFDIAVMLSAYHCVGRWNQLPLGSDEDCEVLQVVVRSVLTFD